MISISAFATRCSTSRFCTNLLDKEILNILKPGVNAAEVDLFCESYLRDNKAVPILKGYKTNNLTFPNTICFSLNDEVVHGIPTKNKIVKYNDMQLWGM